MILRNTKDLELIIWAQDFFNFNLTFLVTYKNGPAPVLDTEPHNTYLHLIMLRE